ncbi:hypothetical protein [Lactobacillus selangorensis]|uniref:hypothetical protein n=1 Tax=Lactobacillus selangorensis TaxID=81857 RepID=UPI0012E3468A|nr:hypothetical protein [Lactobacillus selangorensis]
MDNHEITYQEMKHQFSALEKQQVRKQPQNVQSVAISYLRTIVQALGRMNRTFNKMPTIDILVAMRVIDGISAVGIDPSRLSPEAQAVLACDTRSETDFATQQQLAMKQSYTLYTNRDLWVLTNNLQTKADEAKRYQNLRTYLLSNPTISKLQLAAQQAKDSRCLQYLQNDSQTTSYWTKPLTKWDNGEFDFPLVPDDAIEVSADASGLTSMCRYPGLKKYFHDQGFATEWLPNEFILNPVQYINLYLGILGEAAGKFIVEDIWHVHLQRLNKRAINELFDYQVGDHVAIDFKNWNGVHRPSAQAEHQHIYQKLNELSETTGTPWRVLIINICATQADLQPQMTADQRIYEIPALIDQQGKLVLAAHDQKEIGRYLHG